MFDAPLETKIAIAAAGGFSGMTLWVHDYQEARHRGHTDAAIRSMLEDQGIVVAGIDCLLDWLPGDAVPDVPVFRSREEDLYRVADAVGGGYINVAQAFGDTVDLARATDLFGAICERADRRALAVTLEFIPWAGICDLGIARKIVLDTGAGNARIAIDAWHFFRGGSSIQELKGIDGCRFDNIQLNDGPALAWDSLVDEASERLLPGEGELPLQGLIKAIRGTGFSGPWGIEAPSGCWKELGPDAIGRRCGDAMRRTLRGDV